MFRNYLKTAFRIFTRKKVFTAINALGLSIGISAALIIFLIVHFEFSYDKAETDGDRICHVVMDMKFNGDEGHSAAVPAPLGPAIQSEIPDLEATVPVMQFQGDATAKVSIEKAGSAKPTLFKKQGDIVFTNPEYFSLMPFIWVEGSARSSLKDPFNVVLTESRVKQYFPGASIGQAIGRQIRYNDDFTATVSGVVKDFDAATSFSAVEFISFSTIAETHMHADFMMEVWNDWMAYSQVFVKLKKGSSVLAKEQELNQLFRKYNKNARKDGANYMLLHLQPLSDMHFNSLYGWVGARLAHKPTLLGLLAIAAFLLALACINFINLTTANAASRAREIGIRKTMGSSRRQLIFQFLGETFLLTSSACLLSLCLAPLLLKLFADFIPQGLNFRPFHQPHVFLFLVALAIVVSVLSGIYPALILSGYKPVNVLKNQLSSFSNEARHTWIRKTLTVSQFVIAQFFVIATVMVSKQINYSLTADLGFRKDAIVSFDLPRDDTAGRRSALISEINAIPGVKMTSIGFLTPADKGAAFTEIKYSGAANENKQSVQLRWGDTNFIKLFDIKILAGRNVQQSDTIKEFLINETYSKLLGFKKPDDALGELLDFNGKRMPIVGVLHDFNQQSFHSPVGPLVFTSFGKRSHFVHVLLEQHTAAATSWSNTIAKIQDLFHKAYPESDLSLNFFDDSIAAFYEAEQHTKLLLSWATGLSILISCLGLLGLVMYTINTRTKEICIRKVLGASVASLISILSMEFVQLVLIAFFIAAPIAWWASHKWLEDFAYRTTISWWVFVICCGAMLVIALLTLGIQTLKAALANPVKGLRAE